MKIDKQNGNVAFNDELHRYWNVNDDAIKYISVTTLIEKYGADFDSDFWSKYKALEQLISKDDFKIEKKSLLKSKRFDSKLLDAYNISESEFNKTQQEILDQWAEENRKSCERGTKIHAKLENQFYKEGKNVTLNKFGIGGKFECRKDYSDLDLQYGVYPEYLIYYDNPKLDLHVAGQVDLIVKSGNDIYIIDHKTNKKIDTKGFFDSTTRTSQKMKYPLSTLDECNYNHYQLQLSTYAWMLQKLNPDFVIKDLVLNHYDHDGNNTIYHCKYLKEEVEKMFKDYAKKSKLEKQKAKYARIEY